MNFTGALPRALDELAALATQHDRERLAALADRVTSARLRVLVVGETKRGKSTLVNALIGRALLPAGLTPLTSVATTVRYGKVPLAQVRFLDGHEEKHPLNTLRTLVTEPGNPGNRHGVAEVTVQVNAPLLATGVELVDTPGTGSVFERGAEAARAAIESMDAAVFVLSPDPPISANEQDLLRTVAERSARIFVVLNKADRLNAEELSEVTGFTCSVLTRSAGIPARIYALSAVAALDGGDPGFAAFTADFTAYLEDGRVSDLRRAAIAQARRVAGSRLDEITQARRAAQAAASAAADRVERFVALLAEAVIEPCKAVTAVSSGSARLLFALNDSADEIAASLVASLATRLDAAQRGELRRARATDIQQRGRDWLAASAAAEVASWYEHRKADIEVGLAALEAKLAADLRQELDVLRESATELIGLDVAVPEPRPRLAGAMPATSAHPIDCLAGTVLPAPSPGLLPGGLGRRRAMDRLHQEIGHCVQSQVDAAREDLSRHLAELTDTLVVAVRERFADASGQIQAVLRTAADLSTSTAGEAHRAEAELGGREAAVRQAQSLLDRAEVMP